MASAQVESIVGVPTLDTLGDRVRHCRNCPLWQAASQAVFGEGDPHARLFLIGEQPGDVEDRIGRPFVGPAGAVLERALEQAGLTRTDIYMTNAVKHFKWELRGQRRIHKSPAQREIDACSGWLDAELSLVEPQLVVCLGATAVRALLGRGAQVRAMRGRIHRVAGRPPLLVTLHPAYVLRVLPPQRAAAFNELVADLKHAAAHLSHNSAIHRAASRE